jgi:hypothetical protein
MRHILEFYRCLHTQVSKEQPINYELRKRDASLETDRSSALDLVREMAAQHERFVYDQPWSLQFHVASAEGMVLQSVSTTIQRELVYVFDHAVHHLAIAAIAIRHQFPHVVLDPEIGVSPATVRHQKDKKSCAH